MVSRALSGPWERLPRERLLPNCFGITLLHAELGKRMQERAVESPKLVSALLRWYDQHRRDLPFRRTTDPYAIWVSEVMLQQTQVRTVLPYYERWMRRFPDVQALAAADEDQVLHAFQGLGYYSRARSLLRAAREVTSRFGGTLPETSLGLRSLPGIGGYTAAAIASIAFGERVAVIDGNVTRVLCRLFGLRGNPTKTPLKRTLVERATRMIPAERAGDFNQALMELGATLCTPRAPRCSSCPLARDCQARKSGSPEALPEIAERPAPTRLTMAASLVFHAGRVAILQQDRAAPWWPGMWQFPSVGLDPKETEPTAAQRAGRELLGLEVQVGATLAVIEHRVTRYQIRLVAYRCVRLSTMRRRPENVRWQRLAELSEFAMPSAHRRLAEKLTRGPLLET